MDKDFFIDKLKKKLISLGAVLAGAVIISLILAAVGLCVKFFFPDKLSGVLQIMGSDWETNKAALLMFFEKLGPFKAPVFILIQMLQVLFAPIPGQAMGLLGGFVFGFWGGLLLTMLGLTIGSLIAISLSRLIGEKLVRKFVPGTVMEKFDYLITKGGYANFFMIFLLPALPDDAVCFMAGLSRLNVFGLMLACILGRLPGMAVLTFAGASVDYDPSLAKIIFTIAMICALFIWFFQEEITEKFYSLSKKTA